MRLNLFLSMAAICVLAGCASNTNFAPQRPAANLPQMGQGGYVDIGDGKPVRISAGSTKTYQQQGDIYGGTIETWIEPSGKFHQKVTSPEGTVPVRKVAVRKPNGSVALDKAGNPIFDELPMVAQITPSTGTEAMFSGVNQVIRGLGSFAGTVGSSLVGIFAAQGAATAGTEIINTVKP